MSRQIGQDSWALLFHLVYTSRVNWMNCWIQHFYTNIVSSFLFFVNTVPGLCWASGCLSSSGGQLLTCQKTKQKIIIKNVLGKTNCEVNSTEEGATEEGKTPSVISGVFLSPCAPPLWFIASFYWPDWLITFAWGHKTRPSLPGSKTRWRHQSFPRDRFCRYDACSLEWEQQRNKFRIRDLQK